MRNYLFLLIMLVACRQQVISKPAGAGITDTTIFSEFEDTSSRMMHEDTGMGARIVAFAKTLKGVPYKYCSMTPNGGFDCSGFVNYVFNHFDIKVPRSSVDFTNEGEDVELGKSRPGDLILFTGTNAKNRKVGHIGIITGNDKGEISFIQSTSGEAYGVVVSQLDKNYMARFIKVIRILK